ncbi:hypothetical protein HaLaN_08924, partial [Haematococcus lacustris]
MMSRKLGSMRKVYRSVPQRRTVHPALRTAGHRGCQQLGRAGASATQKLGVSRQNDNSALTRHAAKSIVLDVVVQWEG